MRRRRAADITNVYSIKQLGIIALNVCHLKNKIELVAELVEELIERTKPDILLL